MSLKLFDIPASSYQAEVEYEQLTIRIKLDGIIQHVYHVSGCEIGKCCIKDAHSKSNTFNMADHRALDHILSLHNFTTAVHDRLQADGTFSTKEISIRGIDSADKY
jgi:hypothetical protein